MGCGGAEEEAVGKLLRPLKNNNRLRHLNRSRRPIVLRPPKSCNKRSTVAVSPSSTARRPLRDLCGPLSLQLEPLLRVQRAQVLGLIERNEMTVKPSWLERRVEIGLPHYALEQAQPGEKSQGFACARADGAMLATISSLSAPMGARSAMIFWCNSLKAAAS